MSNLYRVTWEIDVEADDHIDAARKCAENMQKSCNDPDAIDHIFVIQEITEDGLQEERFPVDLDVIDGRV